MYQDIGKRIHKLRLFRGLSQDQLANAAEISTSFLGHIERGTRKLSVETLCKICICLDCSPNFLLKVPVKGKKAKEMLRLALLMAEAEDDDDENEEQNPEQDQE